MKNKIVHINSTSSGGAFSFVSLLKKELESIGIENYLLTRFYENKQNKIFRDSFFGNISFPRFLKKLFYPSSLRKEQKHEIFTLPLKSSSALNERIIKDADILHLHWIADFVSPKEIVKVVKSKKVIWTLHDMNPFTGGCHHSDDCEQYINGCNDCFQFKNGEKVIEYFEEKRRLFEKIDRRGLTIVSPSEWMYEKAKNSRLLREFKHFHIPHFIDTEVFKYQSIEEARKKLSIDLDKKVFLYVSAVLENKRKGWDKIVRIIDSNKHRKDVLFVLVGDSKRKNPIYDIECVRFIGSIGDPRVLADYYSASDFLLNFTVAESFGLTTVEALCCGCPVFCYDIDIMKEHVRESFNGVYLRESVTDLFSLPDLNRMKISFEAENKYGKSNFEKYLELYNK